MDIDEVNSQIKSFHKSSKEQGKTTKSKSSDIENWNNLYKDERDSLQLKSYFYYVEETWRLDNRNQIKLYVLILLAVQNAVVFGIVIAALITGTLKDIQIAVSILIPATLTETAFCFKVIVNYLFTIGSNQDQLDKSRQT